MECHFVLLVSVDLSVSEFIQPFAGLLYEILCFISMHPTWVLVLLVCFHSGITIHMSLF